MKDFSYGFIVGPITIFVIWIVNVVRDSGVYLDWSVVVMCLAIGAVTGFVPDAIAGELNLGWRKSILVAALFTGTVLFVYNSLAYLSCWSIFRIAADFGTPFIMCLLIGSFACFKSRIMRTPTVELAEYASKAG